MGLLPLWKRHQRIPSLFVFIWGHREKKAIFELGSKLSSDTKSAEVSILDFSASRTGRNKSLLLISHLSMVSLLEQPECTKTMGDGEVFPGSLIRSFYQLASLLGAMSVLRNLSGTAMFIDSMISPIILFYFNVFESTTWFLGSKPEVCRGYTEDALGNHTWKKWHKQNCTKAEIYIKWTTDLNVRTETIKLLEKP